MSAYICTITQVTIHRSSDNPLSTPEATVVTLDDMGGGFFLAIKQQNDGMDHSVLIDPDELPKLQEAAQILLDQPSIRLDNTETLLEMLDELDARGLT